VSPSTAEQPEVLLVLPVHYSNTATAHCETGEKPLQMTLTGGTELEPSSLRSPNRRSRAAGRNRRVWRRRL